MDSGLEMADRSTSSDQGRRLARPLRTVSEMLLMNARNAGGGPASWEESEETAVVVV